MTEAERAQITAYVASLDKVIASGLKQNGEGGRQATFDEFQGLILRRDWLNSMLSGRAPNPNVKTSFSRGGSR
ncbi:hypothetical protein [Shinella zoogloeoides]|uniref:hypothetical protein n=1 Tax=Shinella zoogloeoides TaxID=352475 RepID=UPI0028AC10D8|nr:hypothetical protein [Shinella zoogloeoides]